MPGIRENVAEQITAPTQPLVKTLYDRWCTVKGARNMPTRLEMGAAVLRELMSSIYIVQLHEEDADYSMRYMGSAVIQSIGEDFTGVRFSELRNHPGSWRRDVYERVFQTAQPIFTRVMLTDFNKQHVLTESALLPLANRDALFNMILCLAAPVET